MSLKDLGNVENIFKTLAHHDSQLGQLATRVGGVEVALVSLDKKFDAQHGETSSVLRDIQKSINQTQANQGPGIGKIGAGVAAFATILGAVGYCIVILVSAQVSPSISKLDTIVSALAEAKKDDIKADAQELRDIKIARRAENDDFKKNVMARLRDLETRKEWAPTVTAARR